MKTGVVLIICACFAASALVVADEHRHPYDPNAKLGKVSFSVPSCAPSQQTNFERGVALLHSFWYEEADHQFKQITTADPGCAMAYWAQAMSLYHQLWETPSDADVKQGLKLSKQAMSLNARTSREREYIQAIYSFYAGGPKWDPEKSAEAYAKAMQSVYEHNPQDHEAAVFYALSLLASEADNDTSLHNRKRAIAILDKVFQADPQHPGAAHYLIHACDNPQFAQQALPAARVYAKIAPASPHALHMPSHIFARLGLWQEDIQSNLAAVAAVEHNTSGMHMGAEHKVHSMDFLLYAYLQTGDDRKAKAIVDELPSVRSEDIDPGLVSYLNKKRASFPALYSLETHDWKSAEALSQPAGADSGQKAITHWARAVGAGHLRDAAGAADALREFDAMLDTIRHSDAPLRAKSMETNHDEAAAWDDFAQGKNDEALARLRKLADKQDVLGKGEVELPAREMLADMLLAMNRPQEALAEYQRSMKIDPNRFNGLAGAARAAELSNRADEASQYYAQLLKNCSGANSDRPELQKAKAALAQKQLAATK
jgi:tetratricopeptide (TPR) repeat protein